MEVLLQRESQRRPRRMVARLCTIIVLATLGLSTSPRARAAEYAAMVVGLSYQANANPSLHLPNTVNDARAVASALRKLKHDRVYLVIDPPTEQLSAEINAFVEELDKNTVALFYYAGHGVQIDGENYILPADVKALIPISEVIEALRSAGKAALFFFDACRNNPFKEDGLIGEQSRTIQIVRDLGRALPPPFETVRLGHSELRDGLARVDAKGTGLMIVFSTDPGSVALDSAAANDRNSPFAVALLKHLPERRSIDDVMTLVSASVEEYTAHRQTPWRLSSLTEPVYLGGMPSATGARRALAVPPP